MSYSCIKITELIAGASFSRVGLNALLLAFVLLEERTMSIINWRITFEIAGPILP